MDIVERLRKWHTPGETITGDVQLYLDAADEIERLRAAVCYGAHALPDHRPDKTGLDDGPPLHIERKKPPPKSSDEMRDIRARAWATRRQKYGQHGHR